MQAQAVKMLPCFRHPDAEGVALLNVQGEMRVVCASCRGNAKRKD